MELIKNKRADIPVMILVLGVIAICGLAILSFIVSDKSPFSSDSLGIEVFEQLYSDVEKFEFYINVGIPPNEAAKRIDATIDSNDNLIIKNYNPQGIIVINEYTPIKS